MIKSVEIALYEIGKRVEDAQIDLSTKADKLLLINDVKWLMGDKDAFGKRINNVTSATITREAKPLRGEITKANC